MKTLRNVLLDNSVAPAGQGWKLPVGGGERFVLTETLHVIDKDLGDTLYPRNMDVSLEVAMLDVPNLTTEPTNIAYLFAHAVKPIVGVTDAQFQAKDNFLPLFLNEGLTKDPLEAADVFWVVPAGGVELATDQLLVPGFGAYYVDKTDWTIKQVADDAVVLPGTNRGNMVVLIDDHGEMAEVDQAMIIRYANGDATAENFDAPVYFVDFDSTNLDPANMTSEPPVVDGQTSQVVDSTNDFILGNE